MLIRAYGLNMCATRRGVSAPSTAISVPIKLENSAASSRRSTSRAGDQTVMIDPQPLEITLSRGIFGDQVDLVAELEVAEDPDEDLDFEEELLEDTREERHGDSA